MLRYTQFKVKYVSENMRVHKIEFEWISIKSKRLDSALQTSIHVNINKTSFHHKIGQLKLKKCVFNLNKWTSIELILTC